MVPPNLGGENSVEQVSRAAQSAHRIRRVDRPVRPIDRLYGQLHDPKRFVDLAQHGFFVHGIPLSRAGRAVEAHDSTPPHKLQVFVLASFFYVIT
jgi:hypothetical protein